MAKSEVVILVQVLREEVEVKEVQDEVVTDVIELVESRSTF